MDTLGQFKELLASKDAAAQQIKKVCCDMSPAFIRGIEDYFPKAVITFDKFHVMKLVNEAVDKVRIQEQKQKPELKSSIPLKACNAGFLNNAAHLRGYLFTGMDWLGGKISACTDGGFSQDN